MKFFRTDIHLCFLSFSAVIWKMMEDFKPPPWASEDGDDDI